jgi:triosephosphate isomerase
MRRILIAGNWKMNLDPAEGTSLVEDLLDAAGGWPDVDVVVCPPFVTLPAVAEAVAGSPIELGAQNMHHEDAGAYTAEVSAGMLLTVGCKWVILGHSERRQLFGETDTGVNRKVKKALHAGLLPIVCVGETLDEREASRTVEVVKKQLRDGLAGVTVEEMNEVTIAYEPVWAIGTGKVATIEQAGEVHEFIRSWLNETFGHHIAERVRILYGGSVKPDNAAALLAHPDIDGALVGGASLKADLFDGIIRAAE